MMVVLLALKMVAMTGSFLDWWSKGVKPVKGVKGDTLGQVGFTGFTPFTSSYPEDKIKLSVRTFPLRVCLRTYATPH